MSDSRDFPWTAVPDGWAPVPRSELDDFAAHATRAVHSVVTKGRDALNDLARGTHPTALVHAWAEHTNPSTTDLYLLGVAGHPVPLGAARDLLAGTSPHTAAVRRAMEALPISADLRMAGPVELVAMEALFGSVDAALVTLDRREAAAELLCARMRPQLFPATIANGGTGEQTSHRRWWLLLRAASGERSVRAALVDVAHAVPATRSWRELHLLEACLHLSA